MIQGKPSPMLLCAAMALAVPACNPDSIALPTVDAGTDAGVLGDAGAPNDAASTTDTSAPTDVPALNDAPVPADAAAPTDVPAPIDVPAAVDAPAPTDLGTTDLGVTDVPAATDAPDAGRCTAGPAVADPGCSHTYNVYNASASVHTNSTVAWSCSSTLRTVSGNGIPDHATGTFPNSNCPNTIAAHTVSATMTLAPVNTGVSSRIGVVGYALNGEKFDPSTAGTCNAAGTSCSLIDNSGSWNIEAMGGSAFNFGVDTNHAHVQPTGEYHYHGMPEAYLATVPTAPRLVGYALDGFPIYARYGYDVATNACSTLRVVRSSWRVKSTPSAGRPSTTMYPMGTFTQDYEYVAGLGDLDECNGRVGVTPEHPEGIYHYYIPDTFPFIQRCVRGTAMGGGMGPPPGDAGAPGDAGTMMMGPRACTATAECTGACPAGSRGCTCASTPMGMACVPTCTTSAECPAGPMGMVLSCRSGVCGP